MAGFMPLGEADDLDLGVTEPVPAAPVTTPLALTRAPGVDVPSPEARRLALLKAQERAATWPKPDEAVRVRQAAEAQGVPLELAFDAPETVGPPPSLTWDNYADKEPLANLLDSPDAAMTTEAGRRNLLQQLGWADSAIPGSLLVGGLKGGYEGVGLNKLYAKKLLSEDGSLSTEDEAERQRLELRAKWFPRPSGWKEEVLSGVAQQGYRMGKMIVEGAVAAGVTGLVTGGAGAAPAAAVVVYADNFWESTGAVAKELYEAGVPHSVTRVLAPMFGATIAGLDTASAGALTKIPGLNVLKGKLTKMSLADLKPALALAMKDSRFLSVIKGAAWEGSTEGSQEALQILSVYIGAKASDSPVKVPDAEETRNRIAANAVMGAVVGSFFSVPAEVGKHLITKYSRGTEAEKAVNRLYEITDNLELVDRAPDVQHRYTEAVSKKTGVESVTVPAEALSALYQTAQAADSTVTMPESVSAALAEAQATGGLVSLSLADFVTYVRPLDTGKTLMQEVGLNGDISAKETKALKPAVEKAMKEMAAIQGRKDFIEEGPEGPIRAAVEKQLLGAGFTPEGARQQATLLASGVSAISARAGKNAAEVYTNAPLTVERAGSKAEATFTTAKEMLLAQLEVTQFTEEEQAAHRAEAASISNLTREEQLRYWGVDPTEVKHAEEVLSGKRVRYGSAAADPVLAKKLQIDPKTRTGPQVVLDEYLLKHDRGGIVRGTIKFDPVLRNNFIVTLTGKADLSTFLHESSHYLLEVMRKLAPESAELRADLATLEAWAGVKPGEEWSVEALEKFARGMETYLGEGKAPSAKLAQAFATFKGWILHVYKTLLKLNAPLTDEVRSVMDRMVATDEEIRTQAAEQGLFPADAAGDDLDLAREAWANARRIAQERMDRNAITALRKETTAEFKRFKKEAAEQIDQHPVMVARAHLAAEGNKIGVVDLVDRKLSKFQMDKLVPFTTSAVGVTADEAAWGLGFASGSDLIEALVTTPARDTLVRETAKARMADAHPDYGMTKDWIVKEALHTLHNEESVAYALEADLAAAYSKAGLPRPESAAKVAQAAAQGSIRGTRVGEINLKKYLDNEERTDKEARKAYAAKDFKAAAEFSLQRIYSRALWQAGEQALAEVERVGKALDRLKDVKVQAALGRSSDQVLESGALAGQQIRDALIFLAEVTGRKERTEVTENTLDSYLTDLESGGFPVVVDESLRQMNLPEWDKLTVDQVMALKEAVKNLRHLAKEGNEIRIQQEKAQMAAVADEMESNLTTSGLLNYAGEPEEREQGLWSRLRGEIARPEAEAIDLDGGKIGIFHKLFIQSEEAGQFEAERRFRMRRDDLKALGDKYRPQGWRKVMKTKFRAFDGRDYTGDQVFAMLLNMGTESGRTKLVEGFIKGGRKGWTLDAVVAFVHQVFPDKAAYTYAQAYFNYISGTNLWEDGARVKEAIFGVRPKQEVAVAIPLPDGSAIEGGYYPIVYDPRSLIPGTEAKAQEILSADSGVSSMNQRAASGFTRERTGYVAPLLLDTKALAAHLYEVDHFISNAEGIIARHKLINDPRIKGLMVRSIGYDAWQRFRASNNYIAADGYMLTGEMLQTTGVISRLLFGNAIVTMGGNFSSGLNQIVTGLPATLAQLGPSGALEVGRALGQFARNPYKMWKEMSELSGELKSLEFHYDRDLRMSVMTHMTDTGGLPAFRSRFAANSMYPVMMGQKVVNVITFKAALAVAAKEGKSEADAIAFANSTVRNSQSAAGPKDMTSVQRSNDTGLRILTALGSYTFALNDIVMPRRLRQKEMVAATGRLLMLIVTSAVIKELADQLFPVPAEKEDERKGKNEKAVEDAAGWIAADLFKASTDTVANVPLVGRLVASAMSGRKWSMSPVPDMLAGAGGAAYDLATGGDLTKREVKAAVDALGVLTMIPTRGVMFAPGEFMYEYASGNVDEDPAAILQQLFLVRPGQKGEK